MTEQEPLRPTNQAILFTAIHQVKSFDNYAAKSRLVERNVN